MSDTNGSAGGGGGGGHQRRGDHSKLPTSNGTNNTTNASGITNPNTTTNNNNSNNNNNNSLSAAHSTGTGSTASYEDGEGSSVADDEEDVQSIIEHLSSVHAPQISEITPRSALLQWASPTTSLPPSSSSSASGENVVINPRDLRYEVLLSDRGKEGKYKIIFKGQSMSCRIRDLRPGQEYSVCLQVCMRKRKLH